MATVQTRTKGPVALISAAQTITGSWAVVGSEIATANWGTIAFYMTNTINNDSNLRFRIRGRHTAGGTAHNNMILNSSTGTPGSYAILAEDEYVELGADTNQEFILQWQLDGLYPYIILECMAGTEGATSATLDNCQYVLSDS